MKSGHVGVLLIGHGTRDLRGQAEFRQTADDVARHMTGHSVEVCYLELLPPDIPSGIGALVRRGTEQIVAVPVLLFAAGHARRDIPAALRVAATDHPGVTIRQVDALEFHPAIVDLSRERCRQTLATAADWPEMPTLLVLVGRGSSDPDIPGKLRQFAANVIDSATAPIDRAEIGFVAAARPTLSEALASAASSGVRRVIVQPHLLFQGEVLGEIRQSVANAAELAPHIEWLFTEHLGCAPELTAAIVDRCRTES